MKLTSYTIGTSIFKFLSTMTMMMAYSGQNQ